MARTPQLTLPQIAANHKCTEAEMADKFRTILGNMRRSSNPKTNPDYRWSRVQAKAIAKRMAELGIPETKEAAEAHRITEMQHAERHGL